MSLNTIQNQKKNLRRKLLKKRNSLTQEKIGKKSKSIVKKILQLPQIKSKQNFFCYVSYKNEVKTHDLIKILLTQNKTVAVPKIINKKEMLPIIIKDFNQLRPNKFGILEPQADQPIIEKIEINIMPAVAITKNGARLGMGGGYYDRFIEKHQPETNIALAYEEQILTHIPTNQWDKKVQLVVTDKTCYYEDCNDRKK